ncbi:MAG TPA: leucyl/phenylalanyl-tRNA--protein transferase [Candidatus Acidoferrales bacterium]|nr:leucyl/phenylalanyl-tRNA--protein transferase [Candidatus Acidoferrales bacterium]
MPVYRLIKEVVFPPPEEAHPSGLLAIGGDLSSERLLTAYRSGIFPWYSEGQPILWWSPDPRVVIELGEFHVSRRLAQKLRQGRFTVTFDRAFARVIRACASVPRKGQNGTWITRAMIEAYTRLHREGYAHSAESWLNGELAGGVYGVSLGRCFFGESMFFRVSDASKVAFAALVERLRAWEFDLLDAQVMNPHLAALGAKEIPRRVFLQRLKDALRYPTVIGSWDDRSEPPEKARQKFDD